jgi:hypothetical protein
MQQATGACSGRGRCCRRACEQQLQFEERRVTPPPPPPFSQNVLYTKLLQPAFKLPLIAISHTFFVPRARCKPAEALGEEADGTHSPAEIFSSIHDFVKELDADLIRKAARLKVSPDGFSSYSQIADTINDQKVDYKSLYFKWLWQQHLLSRLFKSVKEASPELDAPAVQLPWWSCVELKYKSGLAKDAERDDTMAMAQRLADVINGKPSAQPKVSEARRHANMQGYEIKITGCFFGTAKAAVKQLTEYLCVIQKKKSNMPGYQRPDINVFDLVPDDDGADSTVPTSHRLSWRKRLEAPIRPLQSVHLTRANMNALCNDLKAFLGKKDRLQSMSLKWRRGYLLHGPPGNGKTTFIRAVANQLGCDIFNLSVSDPNINDGNWRALLEPVS